MGYSISPVPTLASGGGVHHLGCVWFRKLDLEDEGTTNYLVRDSHFLCLIGWDERWLGITILMLGSNDEEWKAPCGHLF